MQEMTKNFLAGIGLGAGTMYFLDPIYGKRRRASVRDRAVHVATLAERTAGKTSRDFRNRARGVGASARSVVRRDRPLDDVLEQRIRSKMGRYVSHPGSVAVHAENGRVTLSGPILTHEADRFLRVVSGVRGVEEVINRLEPHQLPEDVPGLQGRSQRPGSELDLLQENWAPSTRVLVGFTGVALALWGSLAQGTVARILGVVGLGCTVRSLTNMPLKRLAGRQEPTRAIDVKKTITVQAPLDKVYDIFSHPENFPAFMEHVMEVKPMGEDRYHWTARGPAGARLGWDAEVVGRRANELLSWRSLPGSPVGNEGTVRFEPVGEDGSATRVHIQMSYNPPGGAAGHVIATLFGDDPKHAMDRDLVRFKSLLENGKTTAKGHEVRIEQLRKVH
jgi:uncharacterized membrane protein